MPDKGQALRIGDPSIAEAIVSRLPVFNYNQLLPANAKTITYGRHFPEDSWQGFANAQLNTKDFEMKGIINQLMQQYRNAGKKGYIETYNYPGHPTPADTLPHEQAHGLLADAIRKMYSGPVEEGVWPEINIIRRALTPMGYTPEPARMMNEGVANYAGMGLIPGTNDRYQSAHFVASILQALQPNPNIDKYMKLPKPIDRKLLELYMKR